MALAQLTPEETRGRAKKKIAGGLRKFIAATFRS
jgi:hypothetical protein